jgi:hypothetical protein
MAMGRFLVIEPKSRRSSFALQALRDALGKGSSRDEKTGDINITIDTSAKTDEGDFGKVMTALSLMGAARFLKGNEGKSEMQSIADTFNVVFEALANDERADRGFVWNYYRPYFVEMKKRGLVEPFCYYIYQSSQSAEVQKWLAANTAKVNEFVSWSKAYRWPEVK